MDYSPAGPSAEENRMMTILPEPVPIATVVPKTANCPGQQSAGNQSRSLPFKVTQDQSLLIPYPRRRS